MTSYWHSPLRKEVIELEELNEAGLLRLMRKLRTKDYIASVKVHIDHLEQFLQETRRLADQATLARRDFYELVIVSTNRDLHEWKRQLRYAQGWLNKTKQNKNLLSGSRSIHGDS